MKNFLNFLSRTTGFLLGFLVLGALICTGAVINFVYRVAASLFGKERVQNFLITQVQRRGGAVLKPHLDQIALATPYKFQNIPNVSVNETGNKEPCSSCQEYLANLPNCRYTQRDGLWSIEIQLQSDKDREKVIADIEKLQPHFLYGFYYYTNNADRFCVSCMLRSHKTTVSGLVHPSSRDICGLFTGYDMECLIKSSNEPVEMLFQIDTKISPAPFPDGEYVELDFDGTCAPVLGQPKLINEQEGIFVVTVGPMQDTYNTIDVF